MQPYNISTGNGSRTYTYTFPIASSLYSAT
jgi:hypothetical protein